MVYGRDDHEHLPMKGLNEVQNLVKVWIVDAIKLIIVFHYGSWGIHEWKQSISVTAISASISFASSYLHLLLLFYDHNTIIVIGEHILYCIATFSRPALMYRRNLLSCVNDYKEPMVIFTTWTKIYFAKYFLNARVAGLGTDNWFCPTKIFSCTVP